MRAEFVCGEESAGERVDCFLARSLPGLTRSQIKQRASSITVGGVEAKLSRALKAGDRLVVEIGDPPGLKLLAEDIPLDVLYEDDRAVVINKAQGMAVHPGAGLHSGTLVNALLHRYRGMAERFGDSPRPGLVHRLDKDTSGVIIAALDQEALEFLQGQFRERSAEKRYVAIVKGVPKERSAWVRSLHGRDPLDRKKFACVERGGKPAVSRYRVLASARGYSLLSVRILTGRTHQIRVHMAHIACPVAGDPLYGKRDKEFPDVGLMLHARSLRVRLPGEEAPRVFAAPLPERFIEFLGALGIELPEGLLQG
jgi:23S rRNA pseudouridine1911/1915/1917 synthase